MSSVTNIKKQEKGRFSVYFRKKHYDFMAHSEGKNLRDAVIQHQHGRVYGGQGRAPVYFLIQCFPFLRGA